MKLPEKPPNWIEVFKSKKGMAEIIGLKELDAELISKANREYLYWDKFKYQSMPDGLTPEEAWAALKLSRLGNAKGIPFSDKAVFTCWVPSYAYEQLHFIDMNAGGQILQDDRSILREERPRYIIRSLIEEAISSSQIEGAATTRAVAKEMLRTGRKPRDYSEQMIYNNHMTIKKIKDRIREPLSIERLNELHSEITKDTLDDPSWEGRLRTERNEIHDPSDQTVLYTHPPPEAVPDAMAKLCAFANDDGGEFIHPVVKAVVLHFWLAWIHPYMDGNGRLARALFYWHVLKRGYWLFEYLSISTAIRKKRIQYYKSFLYSELDDNDMTYFIVFNLETIRDAVDDIKAYIERKEREKRAARGFLKKYPDLNPRQRALLASAIEKPDETYTIDTHAAVHGVVYQSARTDLLGLMDMGLLEMRKSGRKMLFYPVKELREKLTG